MSLSAILVCVLSAGAVGPEAPLASPVEAGGSPHQPARTVLLPARTTLEVELAETLRSDTTPLGYRFSIRLAEPVVRDGVTLIEAGAPGEGEVIDVAKAGMSGRQGKLIIAARHLVFEGRPTTVRGMTVMATGTARVGLATGIALTPYAGPVALLIQGGEIEFPTGMRATVRLAQDYHAPLSGDLDGGN